MKYSSLYYTINFAHVGILVYSQRDGSIFHLDSGHLSYILPEQFLIAEKNFNMGCCIQINMKYLSILLSRISCKLSKDIFFTPPDPYNSNFWLAGSDLRHHGQWEWFPDEDFVVFENWLPDQEESQQHSPTRHCMQMSLYNNFKWVADNCMQNRKFICEHLSTSKSPFG